MAKLPLRFRILHLLSENKNKSLSDEDVMKALESEYGGEGQFKQSSILRHLVALRAVGMLEVDDVVLVGNDQIQQKFKITEYGMDTLKYLPNDWKK